MAGDIAINEKGDVIRYDPNSKAWVPAEVAINEKTGQRAAFDGETWRDLPAPAAAKPQGMADGAMRELQGAGGDLLKFGPLGPVSRAVDRVAGTDTRAGLENFATGVTRGASNLIGTPRMIADAPTDIGNWINRQINSKAPQFPSPSALAGQVVGPDAVNAVLPRASDVQGVADQIQPPRSPMTSGGRMLQDVGQAIGGAPFAPMMPFNVAAGLGSWGAGELTGQNELAKAGGALAGVGGMAAFQNTAPNLVKMLQRRLSQYSPAELNAAQALQAEAQGRGIGLMAQEALDKTRAGPMAQLAGNAAAQPEGAALTAYANARVAPGGAIPTAIEGAASTRGPRVANPNEASRALGTAANAALREPRLARFQAAKPFYDSARSQSIADQPVAQLVKTLDDALKEVQPSGAAASSLRDLRKMLTTVDDLGQPAMQTNVGKLDEALREFEHILKAKALDGKPTVPDTVRVNVQPLLADLRESLATGSQSYRQGLEIYKGTPGQPSPYTAAVDEALASPAARIAKAQSDPASEGALSAFGNSILRNKLDPAVVKAEIGRLNKQDPEAARQALRALIQRDADNAFRITNEGVPPPDRGVAFVKQVAGTKTDREALIAAVEATTGNATTAKGFERLLEIIQRTGVTPGIGSPTAGRGAAMLEAGGGGMVNAALEGANVTRGSFLRTLENWNEAARAGRTWGELADLLTQPDSVAQIRKLALMNPQSAKAKSLAATILQGSQGATGKPR